jgi:hypothetical protein
MVQPVRGRCCPNLRTRSPCAIGRCRGAGHGECSSAVSGHRWRWTMGAMNPVHARSSGRTWLQTLPTAARQRPPGRVLSGHGEYGAAAPHAARERRAGALAPRAERIGDCVANSGYCIAAALPLMESCVIPRHGSSQRNVPCRVISKAAELHRRRAISSGPVYGRRFSSPSARSKPTDHGDDCR